MTDEDQARRLHALLDAVRRALPVLEAIGKREMGRCAALDDRAKHDHRIRAMVGIMENDALVLRATRSELARAADAFLVDTQTIEPESLPGGQKDPRGHRE